MSTADSRVAAFYTVTLHGEKELIDAASVANFDDPLLVEERHRRAATAVAVTVALIPTALYPAFTSDNPVAIAIAVTFLVFSLLWASTIWTIFRQSVIDVVRYVAIHSPSLELDNVSFDIEISKYGVVTRSGDEVLSVTPFTALCAVPNEDSEGYYFTVLQELAESIPLRAILFKKALRELAASDHEKATTLFIPKEIEEMGRVAEFVSARVMQLSATSCSYLEDGKICTETSDPDYLEWLQDTGCKARCIK